MRAAKRFGVHGSGFKVRSGSRFEVPGSRFEVPGSRFGMIDARPSCMAARHYRELVCWQLANDLKRRVYAFIAKPTVANTYLQTCKSPFKKPEPKVDKTQGEHQTQTLRLRTQNVEPRTQNAEPRTQNVEPGTENEP
jgi:hypothetical protein